MKKILLLGGSRYLIPVIQECHKLGYYAITCDFLPNNVAHKYSDAYYNVSIINKEQILKLAQKLDIDGIMSFACDPGVVTAAYVAEMMELPFQCSYESAQILQDKGLFRKFLWDNKFNCPHSRAYSSKKAACNDIDYFKWPVIVKPVDSAGSKGVSKITSPQELDNAIDSALKESHIGRFIIEDFLTFIGHHSSADDFTVNGKIKYCTYSDQLFDKKADNPYTPSLIIWPSSMTVENQRYLTNETQRLMNLLNMKTGIYNIETCVANDGKPYIMEVSPRGGGCKIAEIQQYASGANLIEAEIKKAVGERVGEIPQTALDKVWCEMVIHNDADTKGVFQELQIDDDIRKKYVKVVDMTTKMGDVVEPFTGANKSLGDMFLCCSTREELDTLVSQQLNWLKIVLK